MFDLCIEKYRNDAFTIMAHYKKHLTAVKSKLSLIFRKIVGHYGEIFAGNRFAFTSMYLKLPASNRFAKGAKLEEGRLESRAKPTYRH